MRRVDYKNRVKDRFRIPRNRNDGLLTDEILNEVIDDSLDRVADDLELNKSITKIGRVLGQWQYELPPRVLSVRNLYFLDTNNQWCEIEYQTPESFLADFDEDDTGNEPCTFSVFGREAETFRWSTDSALPTNVFAHQHYVTELHNNRIVCYGANFGLIEGGERIRQGSIAWNIDDDSYALVDYLDFTSEKGSDTATTATSTKITKTNGFVGALPGDIVRRTSDNSYAFIVSSDNNFVEYADMQGKSQAFITGDAYTYGTADQVVMQQYGSTSGFSLIGGTDNTFNFTASMHAATAVTATETDNPRDTLAGTFDTSLVTTGHIVLIQSDTTRMAKVRSVTSSEIKVDYWVGGPPGASFTVTFATSDRFQVQGKFRTKDMMWVSPASDADDIGTERLQLLYIPAPAKPDSDDDPIEIDDRYMIQLLSCMHWLSAERMGTFAITHVRALQNNYLASLRDVRPIATAPTGQIMTVRPGRRRSRSRTTWDVSEFTQIN